LDRRARAIQQHVTNIGGAKEKPERRHSVDLSGRPAELRCRSHPRHCRINARQAALDDDCYLHADINATHDLLAAVDLRRDAALDARGWVNDREPRCAQFNYY